jgi:hypothetical protein
MAAKRRKIRKTRKTLGQASQTGSSSEENIRDNFSRILFAFLAPFRGEILFCCSTARLVIGEQNLLGLAARRRFPIERAIHHLPHLVEPPVGASETLFAADNARAPIHRRQTQFQLIFVNHNYDTFRFMGQR